MNRAAHEGLDPAEYNQTLLVELRQRIDSASPTPRDAACFDAALSAGLLRDLRHLRLERVDARALGIERLNDTRICNASPSAVIISSSVAVPRRSTRFR